MTDDEIIQLAIKCNLAFPKDYKYKMQDPILTGFADRIIKLYRLAEEIEREACAWTASEQATFGYDGHKIAKAIRARGEVK